MIGPQVTVAVVPRERFSYTRPSLESLFENTSTPFDLVYVDGGSPPSVRRYLEAQARLRRFRLIRTNHYLGPNQARNLALRHVTGKYVVFVDNDVLVSRGWLDALVTCAEETGASIVGPLYYKGDPGCRTIHMAGGMARIEERNGRRTFYEDHRFANKELDAVSALLQRGPCELVEFHCMLVRTEVFGRLGPLDENLWSALEHVDLCLAVRENGGSVYLEPDSAITHVAPPPFALSDYPYYMLRWSDVWNEATVEHFRRKWRLEHDDEGLQRLNSWVRNHRHISFQPAWKLIHAVVGWRRTDKIEKALNRCMVSLFNTREFQNRQAA
jgi:GT2 family glycosyltransferase